MADLLVDVGGSGSGSYVDDTPYVDTPAGSAISADQPWDTTGITSPPPDAVLDTPRFDLTQFAMKFTGYTPGESKGFRVWTNWYSGTHYKYTITANGTLKVTREYLPEDSLLVKFDEFNAIADGSGNIRLVFDQVILFALISALDIVDPFDEPTGPTIDTTSPLPPQTAGVDIDIEIEYSGGTGVSVISLHSGSSLPTGLSGDEVTIVDNHLVGKASAGTYNFTLDATDEDSNVTSKDFVLVINEALGVIVCVLDSRTAGTGGTPYPTLFQQKLTGIATVHNRGVGGQTWFGVIASDDEKAAILALYNAYAPFNIIIFWGGTNDAQAGYTGLEIYNQATTITAYYEGLGFTAWVCYETQRADFGMGGHATVVNPILDDLNTRFTSEPLGSKQPRLDLIPQMSLFANAKWSADGIHGTTDTYGILEDYFYQLLSEVCDFDIDSSATFGDDINLVNNSQGAYEWDWFVKRGGAYSQVSNNIEPDLRPFLKWPNPNHVKLRRIDRAGTYQEHEETININAAQQTITPEDFVSGFTFEVVPGMEALAKIVTEDNATPPNVSPDSNIVDIVDPTTDFYPLDIPEMRLYLPEDLTATDGQHVILTDSGNHAQNMIQATSGHQPIYKTNILDGKPIVRFDAVDDFYQLFDPSVWTEATFIYLVKINGSDNQGLHWWNAGGTEYTPALQVYEDFCWASGFGDSRFHFQQSVILNNWHVYSCRGIAGADDTGMIEVWMNFVNIVTQYNVRFALGSSPFIGKNNASQFANMDLAMFGVASKFLTNSQMWNMNNWINNHWNLGF